MLPNNHYVGVQINNYTITKELASGGFGTVFLAQHNKLNRTVAIKLLLAAHLGSQQLQDQFMQEALVLDKVKHQYVLPILDVGVYTTIPYIMMEYASGGSLRDRLNRKPGQPLLPQETLTILAQVGQALQHAHQQNIIHRDIKPENILFNDKGDALLADFGIAIALSTASMKYVTGMIGTPPYMAPEQFKGTIYKESDQYALGCVAYELLTGRIPFQAPDMISMAFLHATETPPSLVQLNAHIPTYVEQAVLKAMAKQRTDRHTDVYAFISALQTPIQTSLQQPIEAQTQLQLANKVPSQPISSIAFPPKETKTLEEWLEDGQIHIQAKRYQEALSAYEQAILLNPILAKAHSGRGDAFYGLKRYNEAKRCYDEATRLDPTDPNPHIGRGNIQKAGQNYPAAIQYYEQALKISEQTSEPKADKQTSSLSSSNRASIYSNIGDIRYIFYTFLNDPGKLDINTRKRIERYKDSLLQQPNEQIPQGSWQPQLRYIDHLKLALEAYNTAINIAPDFAPAFNGKGIIFITQGHHSEALAELQQAIRLDPTLADAYNNMGTALQELGMQDAAISAFRRATQMDASLVDAYYNLGFGLYRSSKLEEALAAFQQVTQLDSNHAGAYQNISWILRSLGKYEEAQKASQRANELIAPAQAEPETSPMTEKRGFMKTLRDWFSQS